MRLFLFLLLPLLAVVFGVLAPWWDARKSPSEKERAIGVRMTIFSWLVAAIMGGALLLLPHKERVLMLVPIFVAAVLIGRIWKQARARARQEREVATNLERMKRVNSP